MIYNKRKIDLLNRDGAKIWLKKKGLYWIPESEDPFYTTYFRIIYEGDINNKNILAIDFSGGPFLSVGDELDGYFRIEKIEETTDKNTNKSYIRLRLTN